MREPFLKRIEKRVVVCDGAMGTMLYARGMALTHCFDALNLSAPQLIKDVHVAYVKAGAELLETNTFGANRFRLEKFEQAENARAINLAGAKIAREVAGDDLYVAGSVGPLGVRLEPLGPTSLEEARAAFREQIEALAEGGADVIMIETMTSVEEARQALLAARECCRLPVAAEMTVGDDGNSPDGMRPEDFARELDACGADLIGVNCSVGPASVLEALERISTVTSKRLCAVPNAGLPQTVGGRSLYLCSPEYMAGYARQFIEAGARVVGGCCGTTPQHVRAIKGVVRSLSPHTSRIVVETPARPLRAMEPAPIEARSNLGSKLACGEFPVVVEMIPPKGCDPAREIEAAKYLRDQGIEAVNIPDGSISTARMSSQMLAVLVRQQAGMEPLLHFSCRGRNVLSLQSDLLGVHALGMRNVWAVTGDAAQFAPFPAATAVYDIDSIGLVNLLNNMNHGLDVGGNPMGTQTGFLIGVSLNPYQPSPEEEIRRFRYKVEAGANFAVLRPVFDLDLVKQFLERVNAAGVPRIPLLAGIYPLTSLRNAEFLNNEAGLPVPPAILDRMRRLDTGDQARAEGLEIAKEILHEIRGLVQGVQIAAPFGRYAMAVEVAQAVGGRTGPPASRSVPGTRNEKAAG